MSLEVAFHDAAFWSPAAGRNVRLWRAALGPAADLAQNQVSAGHLAQAAGWAALLDLIAGFRAEVAPGWRAAPALVLSGWKPHVAAVCRLSRYSSSTRPGGAMSRYAFNEIGIGLCGNRLCEPVVHDF